MAWSVLKNENYYCTNVCSLQSSSDSVAKLPTPLPLLMAPEASCGLLKSQRHKNWPVQKLHLFELFLISLNNVANLK